jgi:hypothetical protein
MLVLLSPCRFKLPLKDNKKEPIKELVLFNLQSELFAVFGGFTVHATSMGQWQDRSGQLYKEEVAEYEVAVRKDPNPARYCLPSGPALGPARHVLRRARPFRRNN